MVMVMVMVDGGWCKRSKLVTLLYEVSGII